ncbi:MAG: hypothetical protein AAFO04_19285 [Cyanobacteria bacterium J06592_8]
MTEQTETKIKQIPTNFQLNYAEAELRRNLPILLKTDCSSAAGIFSTDGKTEYESLEFIPLRIDYTRDAYEGKRLGLLLCVAVSGEAVPVNNKKGKYQVPAGLTFYLMLKSSRTMQGSLDNFISMKTAVEQMMQVRSCGLIWSADFEVKSGSIVSPSGEVTPIKYARVNWMVRPIDSEIEEKLISQLSAEFEKSELFKEVCPFDNDIISQMDEAAKEMEVKRLAENSTAALPES